MRSGWLPVSGWGAGVLVLAVIARVIFHLYALPLGLLAAGGALAVLTGGVAELVERRHPRAERVRAPQVLLEGSAASTVLALGVAVALVGAAAAGQGVMAVGFGLAVAGLGGVARERRASRTLLGERRPDGGGA